MNARIENLKKIEMILKLAFSLFTLQNDQYYIS